MNDQEFRSRISESMPEVPETFHRAMEQTLERIVREESIQPTRVFRPRRALALALIIALLAGTAAFAAFRWHIFDSLSFLTGRTLFTPRR